MKYLLALGLLVFGGEPPAVGAAPSKGAVVIADFEKGKWLDTPPCPADSICLNGLYSTIFRVRQSLAGSGVPARFKGEMWMHVLPQRRRAALLLRHENDGWKIVLRGAADLACFDANAVEAVGLTGSRIDAEDGTQCFLPLTESHR